VDSFTFTMKNIHIYLVPYNRADLDGGE